MQLLTHWMWTNASRLNQSKLIYVNAVMVRALEYNVFKTNSFCNVKGWSSSTCGQQKSLTSFSGNLHFFNPAYVTTNSCAFCWKHFHIQFLVVYASLLLTVSHTTYLTLWRLLRFGDFRKKKHLNAHGFAREFLWSGMLYRPGKSRKRCGKSSSLHSKTNFLFRGCGFFVSDVISGELLGHFAWPWAPTVRW